MGDQAVSEVIGGLSGTPVLMFAAVMVAMSFGLVLLALRAFLRYLTNRNGKMEIAMGKLGDQNETCIRLLQRVADKLGTGE